MLMISNLCQMCYIMHVKMLSQNNRHTISGYDLIEKYKLPTFAITIVRVNNMNIEWYGLGDCEIYMHGKVYRDESFDRVNKRNQKRSIR